ncbi:MAG: hydrolase [Chloroflexota bacterium]
MLSIEKTALLLIDIQDRLTRVISDKESLVANLQKLIKSVKVLGLPVLLTEQYPRGLGPTIPEVASLLPDIKSVVKMSFSCCGDGGFIRELKSLKREQVLVAGIETHVCVYQTVADLLNDGYEAQVVADCVSSRTRENKAIALDRMKDIGAGITSVEMAVFELLRTAESKQFKDISQIIK